MKVKSQNTRKEKMWCERFHRIYDYGIACYYYDSTILHFDDHLRKEAR